MSRIVVDTVVASCLFKPARFGVPLATALSNPARLTRRIRPPYTDGMEVRLRPETEDRLHQLAAKTGRPPEELVEDAMAGYLAELTEVRNLLDTRYDDLQSGRVKPVDGEQAFTRLRRKSEEGRAAAMLRGRG